MHVSCLEHSQMFTKLNCTYCNCLPSTLTNVNSTYLKTFTNVHKVCLYAKFAHNSLQMANPCSCLRNIQECSQSWIALAQYVNSTYFLPRTFTNVHRVCLYAKFAHNSFKMANLCPVIYEHSQMFTKLYCTYCLSTNVKSTIFLPRTFTNIHKVCLHAKFA